MCNTNQAVEILHEVYYACNKIFEKPVCDAYLYGSYARGDFDEDSDVDLFLTADLLPEELPAYRQAVSHIRGQLSLKYDVLISIKIIPVRQFQHYRNVLPYYRNILREGIRYAG